MARMDDNSPYPQRWTTAKLFRELNKYANLETFGSCFRDEPVSFGCQQESADFIREETRLYRRSWLQPIINELARRAKVSLTDQ